MTEVLIVAGAIICVVLLFILFNDFSFTLWKYLGETQIEGTVANIWQSKDKTIYQINVASRYIEVSNDYVSPDKKGGNSLTTGDKVLVWASQNEDMRMLFKNRIWYSPHADRNISLV